MSPEKALAIIPEDEYFPEKVTVNEEELPYFLVGGEYFPFEDWDFSDTLHLPELTPVFDELYNNKHLVPLFSKEDREIGTAAFQQIAAVSEEPMENPYDQMVEGERSLVLFYNTEEGVVEGAPITHGTYGEVELMTANYASEINIPYLEMHTHPIDSLFSPLDYGNLITKADDESQSIVRGIAVAGPNIQILALATPHTPLLEYEHSFPYISGKTEEVDETAYSLEKFRIDRISRIVEAYKNCNANLIEYVDEIMSDQIMRREYDGALTYYEGMVLRQELEEEYEENDDLLIQRTQASTSDVLKVAKSGGSKRYSFPSIMVSIWDL